MTVENFDVSATIERVNPSFLFLDATRCKSTKGFLKELQKRYMRTSLRVGV